MSMNAALTACQTTVNAVSVNAPDVVQITTQQHEDERPDSATATSWFNITPGNAERKNETGGSYQTTYTIIGSLWITKSIRNGAGAITAAASEIWQAVFQSLLTTWGGLARITVTPEDISEEWESGDDADIAYVIRSQIKVSTQEAIT